MMNEEMMGIMDDYDLNIYLFVKYFMICKKSGKRKYEKVMEKECVNKKSKWIGKKNEGEV